MPIASRRVWGGPPGSRAADRLPQIVAIAISVLLAVRVNLPLNLHLGAAAALLLLPVTLPAARRYRGGLVIFVLSALAAVNGALLTLASVVDHTATTSQMVSESFRLFAIGICVITLLWARSVIGLHGTAAAYGAGTLLNVALDGVNPDNAWKFSLSVPVTLLVLSLPAVTRTLKREVAAMVALAVVSAVFDSRSLAATLVIAAALLLIRRRPDGTSQRSPFTVGVQITVIGIAGFFALQSAMVEGVLGEQVQERTAEQIEATGSVLLGGRPELGATLALLRAQPWGYGTGTKPSFEDIQIAKEGMATLDYNPINNGYVDRYMFGSKFEVHSLIGDLWLLGGLAGAAFAAAILIYVVYGMSSSIAIGTATGVALFLGTRTLWDLFFSPIGTTYFTVALCLALLLPRHRRDRHTVPWGGG
ncbi:hypothetical protein [Microbacterium sp.]|uniref:hypothetical protein n=1 Tax=Microbacterium sp. TaxID=51671 RepID=UPI003A8B6D10